MLWNPLNSQIHFPCKTESMKKITLSVQRKKIWFKWILHYHIVAERVPIYDGFRCKSQRFAHIIVESCAHGKRLFMFSLQHVHFMIFWNSRRSTWILLLGSPIKAWVNINKYINGWNRTKITCRYPRVWTELDMQNIGFRICAWLDQSTN